MVASTRTAAEVWDGWLEMWNEDPQAAHKIIGAEYRLHLPTAGATIDPATIRDAASMADWVSGFTGKFDGLRYETDFGPVADGELAVCRWFGTATCLGRTGWPSDVPGKRITWVGVDILRIVDGLIVEAWTQGAETDERPRSAA
ncbi:MULTISPECIES: nuclear transport factor 2 family protein [unclassified Streptomyces]|uniref:nuclear transport factor 2 family protein n=1 Tax=unclassified Streptomyces TaxID=2593676 RepID=UPI00224E060A|nr:MULTISPECIES: nuclear transport factor 2 family protein [unclassified Streptomyces]MCX5142748.1 ester cyclase [Streptomyces sp. NBC_00338]WRZ67183.1 ester cyclase [Streptomyces sp. NBC_01257]